MHLPLKIVVGGIILTISSVIFGLVVYDPLIRYVIKEQTSLKKTNQMRDIYLKIPFPLDFRIYFFNVSNPMDVQNGAKPILKEIGPYCYDLFKEKIEIIDNEMEDSLTYNGYDILKFNVEKSGNLSDDDYVTIVHPIMMGMAYEVNRDAPALLSFLNQSIGPLFKDPKSIYMTDTVRNILFDGVEVKCNIKEFAPKAVCAQLLSRGIPGIRIDPSRNKTVMFSLLGERNSTLGPTIKVSRGIKHSEDLGKVLEINGAKQLKLWASKSCNQFRGTDGWIIPPLLNPEDGVWTHSTDLCKNVRANYVRDTVVQGVNVRLYEANVGDMETKFDEKCYCRTPNTCLKKGVFDLSKCMKVPIFVTLPHFLEADEIYRQQIIGMQPIHDRHIIRIYLEAMTSAPLIATKRLQLNIPVAPVAKLSLMSKLPEALHPVIWIEEEVVLEGEFLELVKSKLLLLKIGDSSRWLGIIGGLVVTGFGVYLHRKNRRSFEISPIHLVKNVTNMNRGTHELMNRNNKKIDNHEDGQVNPVLSGHEFEKYNM